MEFIANMRCRHLLYALAALSVSPAAGAQPVEPFSLKGFTLGQEMAKCPPETTSEQAKNGMTMCNLGATTLANEPATAHAVVITDGKVSGVMVSLSGRGPNANSTVRDALIEKFGQPTSSKAHLNEARWNRGSSVLSFDGYRGTIAMVDLAANRRSSSDAAKENKKDL